MGHKHKHPDLAESQLISPDPMRMRFRDLVLPPPAGLNWAGIAHVIIADLLAFGTIYFWGGLWQIAAVYCWDMVFIFAGGLITMLILLPAVCYLALAFTYIPISMLSLGCYSLIMLAIGQFEATTDMQGWAAIRTMLMHPGVLVAAVPLLASRCLTAFRRFGPLRAACAKRDAGDNFYALVAAPFMHYLPLAGGFALSLVIGAMVLESPMACCLLMPLAKTWVDMINEAKSISVPRPPGQEVILRG